MARTKVTRYRRNLVFERDGHACKECGWQYGDPVTVISRRTGMRVFRMLEVDHIVPVVHGGTNDLDNLQTLCSSCNARKGARL